MSLYYLPYPGVARRRMLRHWMNDNELTESRVHIPIDVKLEDDAYLLSALLPGVDPEKVQIQVINTTVSIQGELENERTEDSTYLLSERPAGRFYRTLELPDPLDAEHVDASMKNGVLTIRVPKAEEARPKTIKVSAG